MLYIRSAVIYLWLYWTALVFCDCTLKGKNNDKSIELLEKLKPLHGAVFTDTFKDNDLDKYQYKLRICEALDGSELSGVTQTDISLSKANSKGPVAVGLINSTLIKGGTDWIMLTYSNGDKYHSHCNQDKRQAHIMIVCDPYKLKGSFKVLYEENRQESQTECFYMMELTSSVACSSTQKGLSGGSIFLIIFFTVTGAYLCVGVIYKRCVYGLKGKDQIPNIGFWKSFGNLQADGCNFLCRCQESAYSESQPYHGIADDQLDDEVDDEHLLPM